MLTKEKRIEYRKEITKFIKTYPGSYYAINDGTKISRNTLYKIVEGGSVLDETLERALHRCKYLEHVYQEVVSEFKKYNKFRSTNIKDFCTRLGTTPNTYRKIITGNLGYIRVAERIYDRMQEESFDINQYINKEED